MLIQTPQGIENSEDKAKKSKLDIPQASCAVILPTYNGERFLEEQIQSILNQTHKNFVLHVFDDRSTDQTGDIVREFAKNDNRIHFYLNSRKKGIINNVSDALAKVNAEIYFLSDQDDIWLPEKMAKQIRILQSDEVIMTFTNLLLVDENGNSLNTDFWSSQEINPWEANQLEIISIKTMVTGCTMAFKKRLLGIALPIPEQATMHDHWLSFFAAKSGRVVPILEELVLYRQHSNNVIGALATSQLIRQKRYSGCLTYQDFKTRKFESYQNLLASIQTFEERLEQIDKGHPVLKDYITFYTRLIDHHWTKAFLTAYRLKNLPSTNSFLRTLFVTIFFPFFYLIVKLQQFFKV